MIAKKILISASAAAMAFAPVAASAAPVAVERSSAAAEDTSELGGAGLIIAILALLAIPLVYLFSPGRIETSEAEDD